VNNRPLHIYEILATQHEPMLLAYVLSLTSDAHLAEDIVQDTFLIAYRKIETLRKVEAFGAWLREIARREALAALRRQGREKLLEPEILAGIEDVFSSLEEIERTELWQERFEVVERCFKEMPEKLREVCSLHYLEDLATKDIAVALRIGLSAVLKRLERGRIALKHCVEKQMKMRQI
jgi:RNA polymerase sigma-70 factor (ECF subfamily)